MLRRRVKVTLQATSRVSTLRLSNNSLKMPSVRDTLMMRGFGSSMANHLFDLKRPAGNEVDVRKEPIANE